ncbi:transposase [Acaryochloris marina]|uniref:RNA-guided endonuclease InsQ/TnpB family protein n=1 Tax=Acaryochloris marina TaxID=155978 RepID=UPI0020176B42|nr:transposase [Acaryochloris marina]
MLTLTYEYKLIPTQLQAEQMQHILDVCSSVWNYALRERKDWIASRKCPVNACSLRSEYIISVDTPYPGFNDQCKSLTQAKKTNPRLKSVNAQVLQQVLRKLDKAFKDMKDRNFGFPRFKKRGRMRSFVFPQLGKDPLGQGVVKLPNIGFIKFRQSRPYPEGYQVKQARIIKRASGFYLMLTFQAALEICAPPVRGHVVGVDVGLEYFLSTSDGLQIERPKFFVDMQRKLKLLQRRLKRKRLGSSNWVKSQHQIALLHERIANTRKDFHFKVAHQLCDQGDAIAVEHLNLIGLSRGMLGKHMLDAGHGQFLNQILPWVCFKRDKAYVQVDARGTSQECPDCGAVVTKMLKDRWHQCSCGSSKPRDVASGEVIRNRAVGRTVQQNACGDGLTGAVHAA